MLSETALSIYASNKDSSRVSDVLRNGMQVAYDNMQAAKRNLAENPAHSRYIFLHNEAVENFTMAVDRVKKAIDAFKPSVGKVAKPLRDVYKLDPVVEFISPTPVVTAKPVITAVLEPLIDLPLDQPVTSTIPPDVAKVDAGYMPAVSPEDVQSRTDISGAPVEQVSDIFTTGPDPFAARSDALYVPDIAMAGLTKEQFAAALIDPITGELKVPVSNIITVLVGVGIIFFLIASG